MGAFFLNKSYFDRYDFILGSDEVGRGCVAGPVVCCTVKVKCGAAQLKKLMLLKLKDSKQLTKSRRFALVMNLLGEKLYQDARYFKGLHLKNYSYLYSFSPDVEACVSVISPRFIDKNNILQASLYGMKFSGNKLLQNVDSVLRGCWIFDGNQLPVIKNNGKLEIESMVKGDEKLIIISLASIIAKEFRDKLMESIGRFYPEYQFKRHAGYLTKIHQEALKEFGPTKHHRLTFKGVNL